MNTRPAVRRWFVGVPLLALGLLASGSGAAQTPFNPLLTVELTQADAQLSAGPAVLAQDIDPVLALVELGDNNGRSEIADGALRGRAVSAGPLPGAFMLSATSGLARFVNHTAVPLPITGSGAARLTVSATFERTVGTGPGLAANTLFATLTAVMLDASDTEVYRGFGAFTFGASFDSTEGELSLTHQPQSEGGFSFNELEKTGSALAIDIVAPALVVAPGHRLAVFWNTSGIASGFSFAGAPGFSATTDFGNTAQMSMGLPAGWGLDSPVPLHWVALTPVPEPASAGLLLLGLACVARRLGRRGAG